MTDLAEVTMKDAADVIYITCPGVVHASAGGRYFIVTPSDSIEVNETAVYFWSCMERGATKEELFEAAQSKYVVDDPDILRRDIDMLIKMCLKKQLIAVNGGK